MPLSEQILGLIITNIGAVILALIALRRTTVNKQGAQEKRHDEIAKERLEREAEDDRQRTLALLTMAQTSAKQVEQLGRLVDSLEQDRAERIQQSTALTKMATESRDQGDTLDTMQALEIKIQRDVQEHRKDIQEFQNEVKPALAAVAGLPESVSGVKTSIDDARKVIDTLPDQLKTQLKPVTDKLDDLDQHVEKMSADLKKQIADLRSEVLTAIKTALQPVKVEMVPSLPKESIPEPPPAEPQKGT